MSLLKRIGKSQEDAEGVKKSGSGVGQSTQEASRKNRDSTSGLRKRIQDQLIADLDPSMDLSDSESVGKIIREMYNAILKEEQIALTKSKKEELFEQIVAEIIGYGPIQQYLGLPGVTEIMVNGPDRIFLERNGKLERVDASFEDEEHMMLIIDRIVSPLGRRIDEGQPMVDARLPDGSRVNVVIPPISLIGPIITIRLFAKEALTAEDLIAFGTVNPQAVEFLKACVLARLNIVISGGTASGKTTLLNILSGFIPEHERIVTIENAAELQLQQEHVVTLEGRPPNMEGKGHISIQDLVINSLRMRPDRIVVGEVRGGEALDMLQAMNTGHEGSLTTAHSNSPRDTLSRLETMVLMAGTDLPHRAIREQIAAAIDLIVHEERMRDGSRKITAISEIQGMEGDVITMSEIFRFEQTDYEDGRIVGALKPTGLRPKFINRIEEVGIKLSPAIFGIGSRRR